MIDTYCIFVLLYYFFFYNLFKPQQQNSTCLIHLIHFDLMRNISFNFLLSSLIKVKFDVGQEFILFMIDLHFLEIFIANLR